MPGWIQKIGPDGRSVFVPKGGRSDSGAPAIIPDIEPYESPVDGRVIGGRRQHRESLKANGCIEWTPELRQEAQQRRRQINEDFERKTLDSMVERMRWHNA